MHKIFARVLNITVVVFLFVLQGHTATPVWTFTPDANYPPKQSVTTSTTATVRYTVTNQSHKIHHLKMQPIVGVTQVISKGYCPATFILGYKQSCVLNLLVKGNLLKSNIVQGPVVCDAASVFQCYQPSLAGLLTILLKPVTYYLLTPIAGNNGVITDPQKPKTVVVDSSQLFTAKPDQGYQVDQWFLDGGPVQKGGTTYTLSNIDKNHTVEVSFTRKGTLFVGMENGSVYYSIDNGLNWIQTKFPPSQGNSANSVFATSTTLYAGSDDGKVHYSTDNGTTPWSSTIPVDTSNSPVNSVFVRGTTIYAGTKNGKLKSSIDGGVTWSPLNPLGTGAINGLFVTSASTIYVGRDDGNVYYLDAGGSWVRINGPESINSVPVQNVYIANNTLYVNTRKTSDNSTLPPKTVDFEYVYSTSDLTKQNPTWNLIYQITYTLFINADASLIYAGTQDGHVFSLTTGNELGFITYSPISSLFFIG